MGDTLNEKVILTWQSGNALKWLNDPASTAVQCYPSHRPLFSPNCVPGLRLGPLAHPFAAKLTSISR